MPEYSLAKQGILLVGLLFLRGQVIKIVEKESRDKDGKIKKKKSH